MKSGWWVRKVKTIIVPVLFVGLAALVRFILGPKLGHDAPMVVSMLAVFAAALVAGALGGFIAMFLSVLMALYFYMEPEGLASPSIFKDQFRLILFSVASLLAILLALIFDRQQKRVAKLAENERAQRIQTEQEVFELETAQRLLSERTAELESLLINAPAGFGLFNREHKFIRVNQALAEINGFPVDFHPGKTPAELIPSIAPTIEPLIERVFLSGQSIKTEIKGETPGDPGVSRYWIAGFYPVPGPSGEIISVGNYVVDITDRKRAEINLKNSEEQFRNLANSIPQLTWMANPNGEAFWYNQRWIDYTGVSLDELKASGWTAFLHPDHSQRVGSRICDFFGDGWAQNEIWEETFPLKGVDGKFRWFLSRMHPIKDSDGNILRWFGTNTDITEERSARAEAERLLKELESKSALFETALEQIPAAVIVGEAPSGRLIFSNSRMNEVWRHPLKESKNIQDYGDWIGFHKDGRRYEGPDWPLARSIMKGEVIENEDTDVQRGDGTRGILRLTSAPVRNKTGEIIAGVVICEDVTDQKRNEAELKRAKEEAERANQLKSAFLANMSHEIRTPLGAMIGFTDLLRDPHLSPQERNNYIDILARNGEQLSVIINDILDLSKVEAGHLSLEYAETRPRSIAEDVVLLLAIKAKEKGLTLNYSKDTSTPESIISDPTRVRQILMNVVGNAIKFTPNGVVNIKSRGEKDRSGANILIFEIEDTGIGIPKMQTERIFDVFVQGDESMARRFGGTGLGLALSRRLARALGGDVDIVRTEVGQGTVMQVRIFDQAQRKKIKLAEKNDSLSGGPENQKPLKGIRVLVVDDSPDNRHLISRYLAKTGADVGTADNGIQGVRRALDEDFDIIIMDIQMPEMDGYAATEKLRSEGYRRPIIALTAHAMGEVYEKCISVGCTDYLPKPINSKDMISMVAKHARLHS